MSDFKRKYRQVGAPRKANPQALAESNRNTRRRSRDFRSLAIEAIAKHLRFLEENAQTPKNYDVNDPDIVRRQAEGARRSTEALTRARERLLKPGVTLDTPPEIPRYHADPDVPGRLIRILRGKREAGYFVDGEFRLAR